jgi:hypothetical protein
MRWQQVAVGVLTGLASTLGSMGWLAWDAQRDHRETLLSVRQGMTAAQVRRLLGPPKVVWTGKASLQAALNPRGTEMERRPPTGWRRAYVYPTTSHTRMVVLLDKRGRATGILDYGT